MPRLHEDPGSGASAALPLLTHHLPSVLVLVLQPPGQAAEAERALEGKPSAAALGARSRGECSPPSAWVAFVFCRIRNGWIFIFKQERVAQKHVVPQPSATICWAGFEGDGLWSSRRSVAPAAHRRGAGQGQAALLPVKREAEGRGFSPSEAAALSWASVAVQAQVGRTGPEAGGMGEAAGAHV